MLRQSKIDMLATLLAIGIDPKKAVIFHQDDVGSGLSCSSSVLLIHLFGVGGLESVSHRVSLDIQLYHADWKIAQDDDVESMRLSPPLSSSQADGQFCSHD